MRKRKAHVMAILAFLMISTLLAMILVASAALGITVNPTSGAPGDSIQVTGTDFGASTPVSIGFGTEVNTTQGNLTYSGTGVGPYGGKVSHWPIKPGSFVLLVDTTSMGGIISTYTDNGDGTLSGSFEGAIGDVNYTTGEWSRTSTVNLTDYIQFYNATYTYYEFNATPATGVTTNSQGSFTTNITVPMAANGTNTITAIDEKGNRVTTSFTVYGSPIPESLSFVVVVMLSSAAVLIATFGFRKPKNRRNLSAEI